MRNNKNSLQEQNFGQGSFLTGFIVGMLAGGAGLFLFGTDDGKKVRKSLNKEWDKAKEKMAEEGVIENSSVSFREIVKSIFDKIGENVTESQKTTSKSKKTAKKKTPSSKKTRSSKVQKFKGT